MNAKEISDSTLESVTPADNDLMLIYDTSEGKTGKATIANLKDTFNKVEIVDYAKADDVEVLEGRILKISNLVFVNFCLNCSSLTDWKILLKNLPIPKGIINFSFTISYTGAQLYPGCGYISTSGELISRLVAGITSGNLYISVCYTV